MFFFYTCWYVAIARAEVFSARLGSARLVTFLLQLENQKSAIFCCQDFFFPYSSCIFTLFQFTLLPIILFLLKITNFWGEKKKMKLKSNIYLKNPARFQLENESAPARLRIFTARARSSRKINSSLVCT